MRRGFALLAMLFLPPDPGTLIAFARSTTTNITWISPTHQTAFSSGDTIVGKWKASKALVSPSVSLCFADTNSSGPSNNDACGTPLWPDIKKDANQDSFQLAVPGFDNQTVGRDFYLKLKDDFGHVEKSPTFTIDSTTPSSEGDSTFPSSVAGGFAGGEEGTTDSSAQGGSDTAPTDMVDSSDVTVNDQGESTVDEETSTSLKSSEKTTGIAKGQQDATAQAGFMTSIASPASSSALGITTTTINVQTLAPGQLSTNNHAQVSAVAVGVPLALVAVALVASVLMCFVHRRSMASRRQKNVDLLATSGNMVHSSSVEPLGPSDVEKAINALYAYEQEARPARSRRPSPYVPIQAKHPIPRTDVRRDRLNVPISSRTSTPTTFVDHRSYISDYLPYGYSSEKRRFVVENTFDVDDSATEAVLSEYLTTPSHLINSETASSLNAVYHHHPPPLHSRMSAPESQAAYGYEEKERDVYEAVSRAVSQSSSHYSCRSLRY